MSADPGTDAPAGRATDPAVHAVAAGTATTSLAEHWDALAAAGLLGTDRRALPAPPAGPVAELTAARRPGDGGEALLDRVALLAAARRAGLRPGPVVPALTPAPPDPRPVCPPGAVATAREVAAEWPVLLDEWLATVVTHGWRLPPDLAVALLARSRTDPLRRRVVATATGPLAGWLAELFPTVLAPRAGAAAPAAPAPEPLPADFARLATLEPEPLTAALAQGLERGEFGTRHRPLLVRLVLALPVHHLPVVAAGLQRAGTNPATMGLALGLADLARLRHTMIQELLP